MPDPRLADALATVYRAVQSRDGAVLSNVEACALRDILWDLDAANELPWPKEASAAGSFVARRLRPIASSGRSWVSSSP